MKNLYKSVALSVILALPMVSEAATVTNDFQLGAFPGTASFGNATNNGAATNKLLPTAGDSFIDNWNFSVGANAGAGAAQVSLVGASVTNLSDIVAEIVNVATLQTVFSSATSVQLFTDFITLAQGNYNLKVTGTVGGLPSSYSGTLDIAGASNVPVPAALWLFGSALIGVMGVSGRKKNQA